ASPQHSQVDQCKRDEQQFDVEIRIDEFRAGVSREEDRARDSVDPKPDPENRDEFLQYRQRQLRSDSKNSQIDARVDRDGQSHTDRVHQQNSGLRPQRAGLAYPYAETGLFDPLQEFHVHLTSKRTVSLYAVSVPLTFVFNV